MAAFVAVQLFYAMLKQVHPSLRIVEQNIQNIVSSASLGSCVAVDQMAKKFCISSHYDPELFPGLRLSLEKPTVKILLFVKGRVVITGGRSRDDIATAWRVLRGCVEPFLVSESLTHAAIVTTRSALRKRKVLDEDDELDAMLLESLEGLH
jgi:TATA-box binding protein (TBP) (component of TFIID and TFIIIB)